MVDSRQEIRNLMKKLVCTYDQESGCIEIQIKECSTKITFPPETPVHFEHSMVSKSTSMQ